MKVFTVSYVGLSDTEYKANGETKVFVFATMEEAKQKVSELRKEEIEHLTEEERNFEILEDGDDEVRISWSGHGEQVRIEVHPAVLEFTCINLSDNTKI